MKKRRIDLGVISDVHLGNQECHADELLAYLNSIEPKTLVLNGDIIANDNLRHGNLPSLHFKVLRKIIAMAVSGTKVYYLTGDHDHKIEKFTAVDLGRLKIMNKLTLDLDGKKVWLFHGDVFDCNIQYTRWLSKFGCYNYDVMLLKNKLVKRFFTLIGRENYSLSKKLGNRLPIEKKLVSNFERTAGDLAIAQDYDYVVCGHIHQPKKEIYENKKGRTLYLNAGDWVENLTALEYSFKRWKIYHYSKDKLSPFYADEALKEMDINELMASVTNKNKALPIKQNPTETKEHHEITKA